MQNCITILREYLSRHRSDRWYLNIVQMDGALRIDRVPNEKRSLKMSILLNRVLDVMVSFALVGMALTVAGATAVLGA